MPVNSREEHGNSPAAWTTVGVMILGFIVAAAAVVVAQPWLFWVGLGIAGLGLLVGWLMAAAGLGSMPNYRTEEPIPTRLEGATTPQSDEESR